MLIAAADGLGEEYRSTIYCAIECKERALLNTSSHPLPKIVKTLSESERPRSRIKKRNIHSNIRRDT